MGNDGALAPGNKWVGEAEDRGKGQHRGEVNGIVKGRRPGTGNWQSDVSETLSGAKGLAKLECWAWPLLGTSVSASSGSLSSASQLTKAHGPALRRSILCRQGPRPGGGGQALLTKPNLMSDTIHRLHLSSLSGQPWGILSPLRYS